MYQRGSQRILPIDASRGLVMLFSCLAHFAWWIHATYPEPSETLSAIGMVATPAFLLISGAMVGMLCATSGPRDLKSQLFNRGLFLLTVGHLLIALAEAHLSGGFLRTVRGVTVVDEIGLCTLVAALFVPQLRQSAICAMLARVAALILVVAWICNLFWMPAETSSAVLENTLIGGNLIDSDFAPHSPVMQHLAIYMLGLPLGHLFARYSQQHISLEQVAKRLLALGGILIAASVVLRLLRWNLDHMATQHWAAMDFTLKVTLKSPPSPAYLLFYGGCALALIGSMFWLANSQRRTVHAGLEWVAVIGRASLFVFVLQYFLYWTLPDLLHIEVNELCVWMFVFNLLMIRYAAGVWTRLRGNRWLTFGIRLGNSPPA